MKQRMKRFRKLLLLPLAVAVLLFQVQALAADYFCTVSIPVAVQVTGGFGAHRRCLPLKAAPAGEDVPMPEEDTLVITDSDTNTFGPITYTKPGDYVYTVTQVAGSEQDFIYDDAVYTVTVRVVNDGEGGLRAEIWAIEEGGTTKVEKILFNNLYDVPDPGDSSDSSAPVPSKKPAKAVPTSVTTTKSTAPKTGDETNVVVLGCLMGISLLGLIALTVVFCWNRKHS